VLFHTLFKKANANIIITLDADTEIEETKRIYARLNNGRLKNKIKYIRLNKYKDFGEIYEKFGKKGIIKVKNKFFEETEVNKISLVAPNATLIVIKDYEVVEKIQLNIPKEIKKIVKCINPNCITNIEDIETYFKVVEKEPLKLQCHYCEKTMTNIRFEE
jgi:aspartate carbamoyltransferase regulatory subunit